MYTYKGITYRNATPDDVVGLSLFLNRVEKENHLEKLAPQDIPLTAQVIKEIIVDNRGVALLALNEDDIIVGTIVLGHTTLWWSNQSFFTNLVFFVTPEYRKGYRIQERLLDITKDFANGVNAPLLLDIFNMDSTNDQNRMSRYLGFKGFKNIGFKTLYIPEGVS